MPRFRNTSSSIAEYATLEHPSGASQAMQNSPCLSASSNFGDEMCGIESLTQAVSQIPTPSPSPHLASILLPTLQSPSGIKKQKRKHTARPQDPNHVPRPKNAFVIFRSHALAQKLVHTKQQDKASVEIANIWRNIDSATRLYFTRLAEEEKRRHRALYPDYKYTPKKINGESGSMSGSGSRSAKKGAGSVSRKVQGRSRTSQNKAKRVIPTPESTPELSPGPLPESSPEPSFELSPEPSPTLSPVPSPEPELAAEMAGSYEVEQNKEDASFLNLFANIFDAIPEFSHQSSTSQGTLIPEFTHPDETEHLIPDYLSIPCLASSAYYNPTPVYEDRMMHLPNLPTHNGFPKLSEEEKRAMESTFRPSAPLWQAHADWDYWADPILSSGSPGVMGDMDLDAPMSIF